MAFPGTVESLLKEDPSLYGSVLSTFASFEPWLKSSKMPFFPEYTDHSDRHVRDVLRTAISLVRDTALPLVSSGDAAVLSLSCLLHDSAMHLSESGFLTLLSDSQWLVASPRDQRWPALWAEYLSEASRFDDQKLSALFGSPEPIRKPNLKEYQDWSRNEYLLIGDFLRRHHARLAQEFAVNGVPGTGDQRLRLLNLPADIARLTGLVARSHGLPLRACLDFLDPDDPRQYKGIHPVFLMTLLRVADYLQLQAERAPTELLKVKRLQSPLSQAEWRVHAAVVDIRNTHKDPEALYIQAAPEDVATYLKLKRLLKGLQGELDECWAVIGEVFGRYTSLAELGMTLRRVRSNLDDEAQFAKIVNYVPIQARFDTAGAELLKLLIRPLYGDRPDIGVRELLQNALDACLELRAYGEGRSDSLESSGEPDVEVRLEKAVAGSHRLVIADRGIGMTVGTLTNYFLRAGASFRKSDNWRERYEDNGHSRVLRSGRFGVGALAAFLLGDQIEVSTRHLTEATGISFTARLETESIQLEHSVRPIGTTITVTISDATFSKLTSTYAVQREDGTWDISGGDWDWFCLDDPKVVRVVVSEGTSDLLKQSLHLPRNKQDLPPDWNRLSVLGYSDIQWKYDAKLPKLVCNGIKVQQRTYYNNYKVEVAPGLTLLQPTVSVFDPDGLLPLNLQRTGLSARQYPFNVELTQAQCRDYLAWALSAAYKSSAKADLDEVRHPWADYQDNAPPFVISKRGSILYVRALLQRFGSERVIVSDPSSMSYLASKLREQELLVPMRLDSYTSESTKQWIRSIFTNAAWKPSVAPLIHRHFSCRRVLLKTSFYKELKSPKVISRDIWTQVKEEASNQNWTLLRVGADLPSKLHFDEYLASPAEAQIHGLAELSHPVAAKEESIKADHLTNIWMGLSDQVVIPFERPRRPLELPRLYSELAHSIEFYDTQEPKAKTQPKAG